MPRSCTAAEKTMRPIARRLPRQHKRGWLLITLTGLLLLIVLLAACAQPPIAPTAASGDSTVNPPSASPASAEGTAAAGITAGQTPVRAEDGVVRLPVADLADGRAAFYTYQSGDKTIPFFVLRSSDGVIRAAFDACDVCYLSRKGYRQEGDEMVCNNCGSRFPSTKINEVEGGCNPAPLDREVQGDTVVIRATDLESGARYFG